MEGVSDDSEGSESEFEAGPQLFSPEDESETEDLAEENEEVQYNHGAAFALANEVGKRASSEKEVAELNGLRSMSREAINDNHEASGVRDTRVELYKNLRRQQI